jgi:hypothetical protein
MAVSDLPDPIRSRVAEQAAQPPLEIVREFLYANVADAANFDEVGSHLLRLARTTTRMHRRVLAAIESVLATPWSPGTLARLVGWDGNWVLDDPSDAGAAEFLRSLGDLLRSAIEQTE